MTSKIPLLGAGVALVLSLAPAHAQDSQSVKDLLNRAQTQSEKRAVDDLITKLRPPGSGQPQAVSPQTATPQPTPAAIAPSRPAAGPVSPAPGVPAATVPPLAGQPAAGPAPASTPTAGVPAPPPSDRPAPSIAAQPPSPATPVSAPPSPPASPAPSVTPSPARVKDVMQRAPEIADKMQLPRADLEIYFDFDRADITSQSMELLATLGKALADPQLAGSKFIIGGHTDGQGRADYNLALSQRRAEAVRKFVIEHFRIDPNNLIARGYGKQRLKNPRNPLADENRRVQIINWTSQAAGPVR